jgi:hypothetical protein
MANNRIISLIAFFMISAGCSGSAMEDAGVTITFPGDGAVVNGVVEVSASAWDTADGVTSVRFDLPDGTQAVDTAPPFTAVWDSATVSNGAGHVLRATASNSRGVIAVSTVTLTVANTAVNCINNTFRAADVPIAIPDDGQTGVTSSIPVTGGGTVASLSMSLSITHDFPADLYIRLISARGTGFVISDPWTDNIHTQFDNQVIPAFAGEAAAGPWSLDVVDVELGSVGTLDGWSLSIVGDCSPATN